MTTRLATRLALLFVFLFCTAAWADTVSVTVNADGAQPRTVTVDLPPAVPVLPVPDVPPDVVIDPPPTTQPTDPSADLLPYPNKPANRVGPGGDLSKLTVAATLVDGEYTASGDIRRNVVAENPGKATLKLKPKQCPQLPDVFAGIVVTGGGMPNSDDLKTAGTKSGGLVHSSQFLLSEGFGLLTNTPGTRVTQSVIAFNGSGGIGGTQKGDVLVDHCEVHHNNLKYKRTNSNKWTRARVTIRDSYFHDNAGRDAWSDNYTQLLAVIRCRFERGVTDKSGDPWKAGNIAAELTDRLLVKDCLLDNDIAGSIYVNEVEGTVIEGNTLTGDAPLAIECRDLARGTPFHTLKDVVIRGNTFEGKRSVIGPSGAGAKIGRQKNNIVVEPSNVGNVVVKLAA